jgi:hypothetical protein
LLVAVPRPGGAPAFVYLAGDGYQVLWSEDGGETWGSSEQSVAMQSPYALTKRALWAAPDGTLWAAGSNGARMRSLDRGRTWELVKGGSREPLFGGAASPDGKVLYAAASGAVLRGTVGGRWELRAPRTKLPIGDGQETETTRGLVGCCTAVWVAPDGALLAVGEGAIWRSADEGLTWSRADVGKAAWDCCWSIWGDEKGNTAASTRWATAA